MIISCFEDFLLPPCYCHRYLPVGHLEFSGAVVADGGVGSLTEERYFCFGANSEDTHGEFILLFCLFNYL